MNRKRTQQSRRGASVVEAALMLPVLVALTFGSVDVAQYINSGHVISNTSREGARIASRSSTDTVEEVEAAMLEFLGSTLPQLTEAELQEAVTIQVRQMVETTTEDEEGEEVTTRTYANFTNGDMSTLASGDSISISIELDYSAIRWLKGPGFSSQQIETICRRE